MIGIVQHFVEGDELERAALEDVHQLLLRVVPNVGHLVIFEKLFFGLR